MERPEIRFVDALGALQPVGSGRKLEHQPRRRKLGCRWAEKGVADNYFGYVKAYENLQTTFNPTKFNPENGQQQQSMPE